MAICRSNAHKSFILKNLQEWVKARKLMPGWTPLVKHQHLLDFEKANRALIAGQPAPPPPGPTPPPNPNPDPAPPPVDPPRVTGVTGLAGFGRVVL